MPRRKGFTLIEVSVSVILLAMVLIGCYRLVTMHMGDTERAGQQIQAYYLAQKGLAVVKRELADPLTPSVAPDTYKVYPNDHIFDYDITGLPIPGSSNTISSPGGNLCQWFEWGPSPTQFCSSVTIGTGVTGTSTRKISFHVSIGSQTATLSTYISP